MEVRNQEKTLITNLKKSVEDTIMEKVNAALHTFKQDVGNESQRFGNEIREEARQERIRADAERKEANEESTAANTELKAMFAQLLDRMPAGPSNPKAAKLTAAEDGSGEELTHKK